MSCNRSARFENRKNLRISGGLQRAASSSVLLRLWGRTGPARALTVHCGPQNPVDARLIASAVGLQPLQHINIKTNGELLLGGGPCFRCFSVERLVERRNVR